MKKVWEWIVGLIELLRRGSLWLVLVVILAGCGSLNSPHGYVLDMDVEAFSLAIDGVPTILQEGEVALHSEYSVDGSVKEMPSTFVIQPDGTVRATGVAATWLAIANYCRIAACE